MTIEMAALLSGITAFTVAFIIAAPKRAPWVPDGYDDTYEIIPGGQLAPDSMFEKYVRPAIRNFLPQTPMSAQVKARNNDKVVELLVRSGNPWNIQPEEYWGLRILAGIAGFCFGLLYLLAMGSSPLPGPDWVMLPFSAWFGAYYPRVKLDGLKGRRAKEARQGLPEALDLLVVTINSGMSFTRALSEVVDRLPPGLVKEELARVSTDLRAGTNIETALTNFARRAPSEEVEAFAKAVVVGERVGADIVDTLRAQSAAARAAYEAALDVKINKLATTLFFPIIAFFLPAILLILFAPAFSSISEVF